MATLPQGYALKAAIPTIELKKGVAAFRIFPNKKIDSKELLTVEVWTPEMKRRKSKTIPKGTELSTVVYYYELFLAYKSKEETTASLIHLPSKTAIKVDFCPNRQVVIYDSEKLGSLPSGRTRHYAYMEELNLIVPEMMKGLNSFPKGGIVDCMSGMPQAALEFQRTCGNLISSKTGSIADIIGASSPRVFGVGAGLEHSRLALLMAMSENLHKNYIFATPKNLQDIHAAFGEMPNKNDVGALEDAIILKITKVEHNEQEKRKCCCVPDCDYKSYMAIDKTEYCITHILDNIPEDKYFCIDSELDHRNPKDLWFSDIVFKMPNNIINFNNYSSSKGIDFGQIEKTKSIHSKNKRPRFSDLAAIGDIENDADTVFWFPPICFEKEQHDFFSGLAMFNPVNEDDE